MWSGYAHTDKKIGLAWLHFYHINPQKRDLDTHFFVNLQKFPVVG